MSRLRPRFHLCFCGLFLFLLLPALAAQADFAADTSRFARLPVLQEGRLKPLASFATSLRLTLSGQDEGVARNTRWLAEIMFDPAAAADLPAFRLSNPRLIARFAMTPRSSRLYTLAELAPGLAATAASARELSTRPPARLTPDEQDLLTLHSNVLLFNQLLQSLSLLLPLPLAVPPGSGLTAGATYLDAQKVEPQLMEQVRSFLTPDRLDHPDRLSAAQQQLALFVHGLQLLRQGGESNQLLRIVPPGWAQDGRDWLSPWQLVLGGQGSPASAQTLSLWQQLATAWRADDASGWNSSVSSLWQQVTDPALRTRLTIEERTRSLRLYDWPPALFLAAGLLAALALRRGRPATPAWLVQALAVLALAIVMGCRICILQRPPVGTLYESMLFVAWVMALASLLINLHARAGGLVLAGTLAPAALLALAPLLQNDGETMTMLGAVLNTNFWLTVHVLCIAAGYGACALTAALAHGLLALQGSRHDTPQRQQLLHRLSLFALLLTATGTLLGGVWADQSWGRFWGWDPKENGALIIVLWLLWLQHGRLSGQISLPFYKAGLAALAVVVAQAWFGVNLLSTGLHSYGFIQGIAAALFGFSAADLLLIAALFWFARRKAFHAA